MQQKSETADGDATGLPEPAVKKTARLRAQLYWAAWGVYPKDDSIDPVTCEHEYQQSGFTPAIVCIHCGWLERWGDPKEYENVQ